MSSSASTSEPKSKVKCKHCNLKATYTCSHDSFCDTHIRTEHVNLQKGQKCYKCNGEAQFSYSEGPVCRPHFLEFHCRAVPPS